MNPIEQEVREMLQSKVRRAPGYDEPPSEILRRARTRRAFTVGGAVLAAAAVIVGVVVVVQSTGKPVPLTTHPIAWRDLQISPVGGDAPFDLSAPQCRAKDVAFEVQFSTSSGSYVEFTHKKSGGRCQLDVPATVSSLKIYEGKRDLGVIGTTHIAHPGFLVSATPHIIYFHWNSYCGPPLSEERWEMTLAGGGRITNSAGERVPPCRHLRSFITFLQAAFDPAKHAPMSVLLRPSIEAPKRVRPGELLVYRVKLTNPLKQTISFGSEVECPNYHEALDGRRLLDQPYQLNCGGAGSVAPGKSVSFEMRLLLPATMPVGTYTFRWGFQVDRFFPGTETTIQVTQ
jgi:hypothetical protein